MTLTLSAPGGSECWKVALLFNFGAKRLEIKIVYEKKRK